MKDPLRHGSDGSRGIRIVLLAGGVQLPDVVEIRECREGRVLESPFNLQTRKMINGIIVPGTIFHRTIFRLRAYVELVE